MTALRIVSIADRGVANQERLHLRITAATNLMFYAIFDTVKAGEEMTHVVAMPKHAFWFSDKMVKPGDDVIVYTRAGVQESVQRADGGTVHFFFWGLPITLWHEAASCAVVLEISNWETSR